MPCFVTKQTVWGAVNKVGGVTVVGAPRSSMQRKRRGRERGRTGGRCCEGKARGRSETVCLPGPHCFVLLVPTPEEYRVPRVNPGVTASQLFPPLLPSLARTYAGLSSSLQTTPEVPVLLSPHTLILCFLLRRPRVGVPARTRLETPRALSGTEPAPLRAFPSS